MRDKILLFFKGILMGVCDLIPGISGGTIAFITGIYERLINAVKGFSLKLISGLLTCKWKEFKEDVKKLDLGFLLVLGLGIITALFAGSRIIKFLLDNYFVYTLSFFVGLILASSILIFEEIKNHNLKNIFFGFFGFVFGILFIFLAPVSFGPSLGYVFFGGFVAISAMFLPGISGAFILLIMGLYDFMINVLHNPFENFWYLAAFIAGVVLGAYFISRLISFLFERNKCRVLYFLLGLVVGALSIPIKRIYESGIGLNDIPVLSVLLLLGVFLVILVKNFEKNLIKINYSFK